MKVAGPLLLPLATSNSGFFPGSQVLICGGGQMTRKRKSRIGFRRRRRRFAWIFGASATVIALLYWEQTAALYILSTLAMCALMLVVAFSNLEARDKEIHQANLEKTGPAPDDAESARFVSPKRRVA